MKTLLLTTLSVLALTIHSCSKSPKCWGKDKNKGDISSELHFFCEPVSGDKWVINDENTYKSTFDSTCTELPAVDFTKYTLLGVRANGSCNTKYIREVERSDNGDTQYKVTVKSCGTCKSMVISNNWVLIPKIPDNAVVTFDVKEK